MEKSKIIGILAVVLILGGIIWMAQPNLQMSAPSTSSLNSGGSLQAEESSFDFGTISMAAGKVAHSFKIKNVGAESAVIEKMYTSCMCTTAALELRGEKFGPYGMPGHGFIPKINERLAPGEEAAVEVVFDPAAHGPAGVGLISRVVAIEYGGGEPLEFKFSAMVTP